MSSSASPSLFPEATTAFFRAAFGAERLSNLLRELRRPPGYTTIRVNFHQPEEGGKSSNSIANVNAALHEFNTRLAGQGREPVTAVAHKVISDAVVIPSAKAPAAKRRETTDLADGSGRVIVDRLCAEAVLRGADIFSAGVLSCSHAAKGSEVRVYAVCRNRVPRGSKFEEFSSAAETHGERLVYLGRGICEIGRSEIMGHPTPGGVAIAMLVRSEEFVGKHGDAPPLNELVQSLGGKYFAQNLPSMFAAHALCPKPGEIVCDMCAAPGGKSTHLASLMQGRGIVIALDRSRSKVARIQRLANLQGYGHVVFSFCANSTKVVAETGLDSSAELESNANIVGRSRRGIIEAFLRDAKAVAEDSATWRDKRGQSEIPVVKLIGGNFEQYYEKAGVFHDNSNSKHDSNSTAKMKGERVGSGSSHDAKKGKTKKHQAKKSAIGALQGLPEGVFDRVLLDPPCSALGQRPRLLQPNTSLAALAKCADYDMAFMREAVRLLKPGGVLVYSTCTFNPLENELVVAQALRVFPCLTLEPLPASLMGSPPQNATGRKFVLGTCGMEQAEMLRALNVIRAYSESSVSNGVSGRSKIHKNDVAACRSILSWDAAHDGGLTYEQSQMVRRFDPDGPDDTIGFFVARFRKKMDTPSLLVDVKALRNNDTTGI